VVSKVERPKVESVVSGDRNRAPDAYIDRVAMPGDRVLAGRGGGDLRIYEEIASDAKVKAAFEQRRNAVIAKEWRVEAGGTRRVDIKAAEHLERQLRQIGFDTVTDKMLWGVFYGFSAAEVLWGAEDGLLVWNAIKVRRRRKFKFTEGGELRRFDRTDPVNGAPAPPPYFWHFATGADNDDEPYGLGLAHFCYWYVLFKRQGIKFWLTFLEKFASPTVRGTFPVGASDDEKRLLLAAATAIRSESAIIHPEGMTLDLIEAARNGSADYKVLHDTMNAAIEQVIIGQTAGSSGTPGKLGGDDLQGDVRADIIKADADLICESLNNGPVRWLTEHNFAGAAMPRVFRVIEEPEDANSTAERDTTVKAMGYKPSLAYVREQYGDHWEEAAPVAAQPRLGPDGKPLPPQPGVGAAPGEFAEGSDVPDYTDALVDALAQRAGPVTDGWLDTVRAAVDSATTYDELLGRLADMFETLPLDELGLAIEQAGAAAGLAGRYDATVETAGAGDA
jgi:phage gp29-like protein